MSEKFSIKVISSSCGVKTQTLRAWEARYGLFNPERSPGGQRLYSSLDLKKVLLIVKLQERGHSIGQLAEYSVDELESMLSTLDSSNTTNKAIPLRSISKKFLLLLTEFKLDLISDELSLLRCSLGAKEFIMNTVLPILREIGILVESNKLSVTQEHIVSTLIRDQLAQIQLPIWRDRRREAALATPEGNFHELPILMADILCKASKVPTRYLGASHPANCLGEALNALKCPNLILGAVSSDKWIYQKQINSFLLKLDRILEYPLKVFIGGGEKKEFPKFKMITEIITFSDFEGLLRWLDSSE